MKKISRQIFVPYTAEQMFNLINDVAKYPEFLPWCSQAEIEKETKKSMTATLTLSKGGMSKSFTTQNKLDPSKSIDLELVEGPFKDFAGKWLFEPIGATDCKVSCEIGFEFSSYMLEMMFGAAFEQITTNLIDAFEERAKQIYGLG